MATPFVAGAVARILHENPEYSRAQVVAKLFANAKAYDSGLADDAPRMLQTPTVEDGTLAANAIRKASAEAELERLATEKAAADKAAALSTMSKSLKVKALTKQRISISVTAPVGSKTIVQRKVGSIWKTLTTKSAVKSRVVKVSSSGTYRVQIKSTNGTVTSKTYKVK
jgi:archaellin